MKVNFVFIYGGLIVLLFNGVFVWGFFSFIDESKVGNDYGFIGVFSIFSK